MSLRLIYLLIAIPGAIVPMFFFVRWFEEFGYDIVEMTVAWPMMQRAVSPGI